MRGGLRHPCGAVLLGEMGSKEVVYGKKKAKESCGEGGKRFLLEQRLSWTEPMTCLNGSK